MMRSTDDTQDTRTDDREDDETLAKVKALLDEKLEEEEAPSPESYEEEVAGEEDSPDRAETSRNTMYDEGNVTQGMLYSWSMMVPELGSVQVTDMEKSRYLKASLNDSPVVLPIELDMGDDSTGNLTVELRTINNYEYDVVFLAIERDREEGLILGHHQLATYMQRYAGALQLLKFQNRLFENISFSPGKQSIADDVTALREHVRLRIGAMNWPKWQAVLMALRIFETKIKICNDAAMNGDFWTPQDARS